MAIRPVDLQVLIPRSVELLRTEGQNANRPGGQQQVFSEVFQKKTEDASTQVLHTEKAEQNAVDKDGRSGNQYSRQKKKKQNRQETVNKNKSDSTFDFSV